MKKLLILIFCCAYAFAYSYGQSKTPTVMVVPEEAYCINNNLYKTGSNGEKVPDYKKALYNENILDAINTFGNLMAERGFELQDLQTCLNELDEQKAMEIAMTAKDDGMAMESDIEKLMRTAKADILVKISPRFTPYGPQKKLEMRVTSIDCASKKTLLSFGPVTKTTAGSASQIVKAAVTDNIESFCLGLGNHFRKIQTSGREGSIIIKVANTCPLNLESTVTYQGEQGELADLIAMWLDDNTVGGSYTGGKNGRYEAHFDQVKIPLVSTKKSFGKSKQRAINMEDFVKTGLTSLLENYGISVATQPIGIGKVYMMLGRAN